MTLATRTLSTLNNVITSLVECGLAHDQNYGVILGGKSATKRITYAAEKGLAVGLKKVPYLDIYRQLLEQRAFHLVLPFGGILQMIYVFREDSLIKHRLSFFPNPDIDSFGDLSDDQFENMQFEEVIAKNCVPFPIRFDFVREVNSASKVKHLESKNLAQQNSPVEPAILLHHELYTIEHF